MSENIEQKITKTVAETLRIEEGTISPDSKFVAVHNEFKPSSPSLSSLLSLCFPNICANLLNSSKITSDVLFLSHNEKISDEIFCALIKPINKNILNNLMNIFYYLLRERI